MMSLVIPFRWGMSDSFELRTALRSWEKFGPEIQDCYLIGQAPNWYFGTLIPCEDEKSLPSVCRVLQKLKVACEDPRITEDFIFTNDDMYLVQPFKAGPFYMKNSPLRADNSFHHKGFQLTFDELDRIGWRKPYWDCELHHPCIYNKTKALKLLNSIDIRLPYSFRTLYFNLLGVQLAPEYDHKRFDWFAPRPNDYCVSSNDSTLGQEKFVKWAKEAFPNKSRWEA